MESTIARYLNRIYESHLTLRDGKLADYIPQLLEVDEDGFAIGLATVNGTAYGVGDVDTRFTIQSVSKPFTYALALMDHDIPHMARYIDVEPSGDPFNEISVDSTTLRPRNAMINAGAITAASQVRGDSPADRFSRILAFYSRLAGAELDIDLEVFTSEMETANRNRAIGYLLREFGMLQEAPETVLDSYIRQCAVRVTCNDLAWMAATLANDGIDPRTGERLITSEINRHVLSVMATCGMYNASGEWLTTVGLPAKSGVGGGIIAVLPGQCGIAVYSPRLDPNGNSVRGIAVFTHLAKDLGFHFLNVSHPLLPAIKTVTNLDRGSEPGRVTAIELQGSLQFAGAESLERILLTDRDTAIMAFILDLEAVSSIDEVGLRMLIGLGAQLGEQGIPLALVDPSGRFRADQPGTDVHLLHTFDDRPTALTWATTTSTA